MRKAFLPLLAAIFVAVLSSLALPGMAGASERGTEHAKPNHGDVSCMAIGICPDPLPPERCDAAGNCVSPPIEGCYEGPNGDCMPPWCDHARPVEDCPTKPPAPPFCEDGAEVCIPPMPPWCDEAGNCEPPPRPPICEEGVEATEDCIKLPPECWVVDDTGTIDCLPPWCDPEAPAEECPSEPPPPPLCDETSSPADFCVPPTCDPAETNPKFCRPYPEDPIVCVMGWPSDEPMPECPGVYPPPCGDGQVTKPDFSERRTRCMPPPICEPTDPDGTDPTEGEGESGAEPGDDGVGAPEEYGTEGDPSGDGSETSEDPLPCIDPPVYGCFEDENGQTLCVDPPIGCWEEEGKEGLIACFNRPPSDPETADNGEVKRNNKGKKAKAKARARAKKAKAAKNKKAKAKKAKAKAARN